MEYTVDASRKEADEKINSYDSKLDNLTAMMEKMMYQIKVSN